MKLIHARNYRPTRRKPIRLIVWHDMESPEAHQAAENVAEWMAGPSAPMASAHLLADDDSVVESVLPHETAFGAPNANADGYHLEQAGRRNQGATGWRDPFSLATIRNLCREVAAKPELANIPDRWLTDAQLADGVSAGHTTHEQITKVLGGGTHTDPGPDFPKVYAMDQMIVARGRSVQAPAKPPADRWLRRTNPPLVGADVAGVRHALRIAGNHELPEGVVYDQATADLVNLFQQRHNIPERGVGPLTWAALRKVVHR